MIVLSLKQSELADLALSLYNNVDDADQFSFLVPYLLKNSSKSVLKVIISSLATSVEKNISMGNQDVLQDDLDELIVLVEKAKRLKN